jgi:competence ComEA-like helix-hairpin-helix protein
MKHGPATNRLSALFVVLALTFITSVAACYRSPPTVSPETVNIGPPTSPSHPQLINLNTASAVELARLPGVGPTLAERIIKYREENGPFRRPEHLMMVRGISERKFREISRMVKVE